MSQLKIKIGCAHQIQYTSFTQFGTPSTSHCVLIASVIFFIFRTYPQKTYQVNAVDGICYHFQNKSPAVDWRAFSTIQVNKHKIT